MIFFKHSDSTKNVIVTSLTFPIQFRYREDAIVIEPQHGNQFKYEIGFPDLFINFAFKNLTRDKIAEIQKFFVDEIQFKNQVDVGFIADEESQIYIVDDANQLERMTFKAGGITIDTIVYPLVMEQLHWHGDPSFNGRLDNFGINSVNFILKKKLRTAIPTITST